MAKKTLAEKMAENSRAVYENMKTHTIGSFSSTENIKKNIVILDELRDLIPPLLESEFLALKDNLLKHGCKDPLKIWQTTNRVLNRQGNLDEQIYILIDGHNRFQICTELQIPFNIQIDNFESLKEVRDFMIDFQLSRRNITPQQASYLRGLRYNTEKREVSDNLKATHTGIILPNGQNVHLAKSDSNIDNSEVISETILPNGQNVHLAKTDPNVDSSEVVYDEILPNGQNVHLANKSNKTTAQVLGEYFNVDEKTIRRDAEFARGLEKLDATFRKEILNGKVKVEKTKIQRISKANEIKEPLKTTEELNFAYNNLISNKSKIVAPQESNLVDQKYFQLNAKLQKVYKSKKIKSTELEALKTAFQEFIDAF